MKVELILSSHSSLRSIVLAFGMETSLELALNAFNRHKVFLSVRILFAIIGS